MRPFGTRVRSSSLICYIDSVHVCVSLAAVPQQQNKVRVVWLSSCQMQAE
eukprot:COSAG02_NODE_51584_length_313_cov_0.728972_1_plen_49_part_01